MTPKTTEQFKKIRQESKTKIMVVALELFAIDGYHNTAISKIAKHAGISKGLMYNYFDSKEELLKEVVIMAIEDVKSEGEELLIEMKDSTPNEILRTLFDFFFDMLVKNKAMWKLTFSLALQVSNIPSIEEEITNIFKDIFNRLEMVLQINNFEDCEVEARLLAAHLDGIFFHYLIFGKTYDLVSVKNKLIDKYCNIN